MNIYIDPREPEGCRWFDHCFGEHIIERHATHLVVPSDISDQLYAQMEAEICDMSCSLSLEPFLTEEEYQAKVGAMPPAERKEHDDLMALWDELEAHVARVADMSPSELAALHAKNALADIVAGY
ncbi:hypothetical protein AB9F29_00275 [Falsihalocynthiibacter sp. S25ZX9]|uniref:hypothetical protein n=1 Tax=Falsihalocynthiibacter sp. S25ZX9 TaxID=3240870 RepID=UPI00350F85C6